MNSYSKTTWVDNNTPALNAENLNHIEQGIKDVTDEVINGTLHIVDVPYTAENNADSCTTPNTLYYVWVASSVVTHGKMYVLCTPRASSKMSQVALSKEGFLLIRSSQNADFSGVEWVLIPTASNVSTMINNAVSGKANSSDVYTKTQADETFVDKTTYNADLGEIDEQLLQKVDKEAEKGLSTNDFTDSDKNLLEAGCTETKNRFNLGTDIILGKNNLGGNINTRAITKPLYTGDGSSVVYVKSLPANLKYKIYAYPGEDFSSPTDYTSSGWIDQRGQSMVINNASKRYIRVMFGTVNNQTITAADFNGLEMQVEAGTQKTDYAPKYTAFDYVARNRSYPVHLKVCSYNVGMYSYGISTDTPAANAVSNLVDFLEKNNFDIIGIQEGRRYVDGNDINEKTYNDFFISQKNILNNCAIKSQFVLKETGEGTFTAGSRKYVYAIANIGNKEVFIISVHFALNASDRSSNYTELLALLSQHEYFIVFGDFNAAIEYSSDVDEQTQAEFNNLINAGYTVANGGRWGLLNTMGTTSKHPDNICVSKNIKMISAKVADVYSTMNSDHLPIVVDIVV